MPLDEEGANLFLKLGSAVFEYVWLGPERSSVVGLLVNCSDALTARRYSRSQVSLQGWVHHQFRTKYTPNNAIKGTAFDDSTIVTRIGLVLRLLG